MGLNAALHNGKQAVSGLLHGIVEARTVKDFGLRSGHADHVARSSHRLLRITIPAFRVERSATIQDPGPSLPDREFGHDISSVAALASPAFLSPKFAGDLVVDEMDHSE